jgi:hypothetical protein
VPEPVSCPAAREPVGRPPRALLQPGADPVQAAFARLDRLHRGAQQQAHVLAEFVI